MPFTCEKCHKELRGVIRSEDLRKVSYQVPPIKCPKCSHSFIVKDDKVVIVDPKDNKIAALVE